MVSASIVLHQSGQLEDNGADGQRMAAHWGSAKMEASSHNAVFGTQVFLDMEQTPPMP